MQRSQLIKTIQQFRTENIVLFSEDTCAYLSERHENQREQRMESFEGIFIKTVMDEFETLWFHVNHIWTEPTEEYVVHEIKRFIGRMVKLLQRTDEPLSPLEHRMFDTLLFVMAEAVSLKRSYFNLSPVITTKQVCEGDYVGSDGQTYHAVWYKNKRKIVHEWYSCDTGAPEGIEGYGEVLGDHLAQTTTETDV